MKPTRIVSWLIVLCGVAVAAFALLTVSSVDKMPSLEEQAYLMVSEKFRAPLLGFRVDTGRFPTTVEGFHALLEAPDAFADSWNGPYIEKLPMDPWGNEIKYGLLEENGCVYKIWSTGPSPVDPGDDIVFLFCDPESGSDV